MNGIFNIHILIIFFNQINTSLLYTIYLFHLIGYVHIVVIFTASLPLREGLWSQIIRQHMNCRIDVFLVYFVYFFHRVSGTEGCLVYAICPA